MTEREIEIVMNALAGHPTVTTSEFANRVEKILRAESQRHKEIVIIDEDLSRGISIAEGIKEEFGQDVDVKILHYCNRPEDSSVNESAFAVEDIDLFTFNKKVSEYFEATNTVILCDLLLEDAEWGITFPQRVNIRFALMRNRIESGKIWFYDDLCDTPTRCVLADYNISPYFLETKETMITNGRCRLELNAENFMK